MLIPDRNPFVRKGDEFFDSLKYRNLSSPREEEFLNEFLVGANVPRFYRSFVQIEVGDDKHSILVSVAPDYLSLGEDDDYVRVPTNPITAQKIADAWGCCLPTKKMVDLIWQKADIKLDPFPLPPTAAMTTVDWFKRSNDAIRKQLAKEQAYELGNLVAGHKKDVVITSRIFKARNKVAIYGWHRKNGSPIQGPGVNAGSHDAHYADYSHGIRLIDDVAYVDGVETTVQAILADPDLCKYLSEEGIIVDPRYDTT